ncbi:MAG: hypothetical protein CMK35_04180, partial [Porticoccaceae bacterium]|nr:hypothetical protein [Porticoccaceae bacterium]
LLLQFSCCYIHFRLSFSLIFSHDDYAISWGTDLLFAVNLHFNHIKNPWSLWIGMGSMLFLLIKFLKINIQK